MFGENYGFQFCGGKCSPFWQGKRRVTVASDQNKLPIGLVVKHLGFIKISKILISRKISEIKNCDVVPLFYIKTMNRKTL